MEAQSEIEEPKQQNMMPQETIDRVRFEMDTIRQSLDNVSVASGDGHNSASSAMSRLLGVELPGQLGEEQDGRLVSAQVYICLQYRRRFLCLQKVANAPHDNDGEGNLGRCS